MKEKFMVISILINMEIINLNKKESYSGKFAQCEVPRMDFELFIDGSEVVSFIIES